MQDGCQEQPATTAGERDTDGGIAQRRRRCGFRVGILHVSISARDRAYADGDGYETGSGSFATIAPATSAEAAT